MKVLFLLHSLGIDERLGVMQLSSILQEQGHSTDLLLTGKLSREKCLEAVTQSAPDVLAYSIMTGEHGYHIALNEMIRKEYACFSVFGGPHPTFRPEIIEQQGIDAVCRGEGDLYFPELLKKMNKDENFYHTPNFWLKKSDGTIIKNEIGPLVKDLNTLPFPDRRLVYNAAPALRAKGKKMFMAMRGCPYKCSFCFNHAYNRLTYGKGKMLRYRSVSNLLDEIKTVIKNYFLDRVVIDDDTFLVKPDGWLEEFASRYPAEINYPLTCNIRIDLITEEKMALLKQMGCETVIMGVDPPNLEITQHVLRRNISKQETIKACCLIRKYNIKVITQNLVGLPVDNPLEAAYASLDFNIRLRPYLSLAHMLYPYPGTEIERLAIEKGMFHAAHEKSTPTNQLDTDLIYSTPKVKSSIINLTKLFGFVIQFPWLRPLTPLLIALPLKKVYTQLFYIFWGYKMFQLSNEKILIQAVKSYLPFYFKNILPIEKKDFSKTDRP